MMVELELALQAPHGSESHSVETGNAQEVKISRGAEIPSNAQGAVQQDAQR